MRQRAMIAMGLANEPSLLIADEPTTALDVTVQAQVIQLLKQLNRELGTAIILITHNTALVASMCQRVIVMYAGRVVEGGPVERIFGRPEHPYPWSLLRSVPRVDEARKGRLVSIRGLPPDLVRLPPGCKFHPRCLFKVDKCLKEEPELEEVAPGQEARCWVKMSTVSEETRASAQASEVAFDVAAEPLDNFGLARGKERRTRVQELLRLVGLNPNFTNRYPHEFSGGQRQRIGIARALSVSPSFIVCDEPVSALDVSIQAQIINLLQDLQKEFQLTYLFIAHDLAVVRHLSDRIAVMYLGKVVEIADRVDIYEHSQHPYTKALLSSIPVPDPLVERGREPLLIKGGIPSAVKL